MFTRELELLREVSELCGEKDGKPNISVFDLQHFSKEKNEVLLMAGRMKPAVVQLLDIGRLDHMDRNIGTKKIHIETPARIPREQLDFSIDPNTLQESNDDDRDLSIAFSESNLFGKPFCVDDLVKKIDQKIAELEEEERREDGQTAEEG